MANDYVSFLPIRAGIQGYLAPDVFVTGEAGTVLHRNGNDDSRTGVSYGLGAGYRVRLNPLVNTKFVQLSGSYNFFRFSQYLNYTWFNLRAAYGLTWGKKSKLTLQK